MHQNETTYAEHGRTIKSNSVEITSDQTMQLFMSKIDLDYAYGQMKLSEETSRQCAFALTGENLVAVIDFKKSSTDLPTFPQYSTKKLNEHSDTVPQRGWKNIIIVTRGSN